MPRRDVEARREYDNERRRRIMADPELVARRREQGRVNQKRYVSDPVKRDVQKARCAAWRAQPDKVADAHLWNKYRIRLADYREMLARQNGVCAICRGPETKVDPRTKRVRNLAVDHCHTTGRVRGLLCYSCNVGIGFLAHDRDRMRRAQTYLEASCAED